MRIEVLERYIGEDNRVHNVGEVVDENDARGAELVRQGFAKRVDEALKEMPVPTEDKGGEIKDISEVVPKAVEVEGPQRNVEELVGKVIVINQFGFRKSQYEGRDEYATVQITEDNGIRSWFNTGSGPIVDALKQVEDKLPVRCRIAQRKSEKGRRYFALESAKETK